MINWTCLDLSAQNIFLFPFFFSLFSTYLFSFLSTRFNLLAPTPPRHFHLDFSDKAKCSILNDSQIYNANGSAVLQQRAITISHQNLIPRPNNAALIQIKILIYRQSAKAHKNLRNAMITMDSQIYLERGYVINVLTSLADEVFRLRMPGAAVFELTGVAQGITSAHISFLSNPWDVAAGFLMIKEAGGKIPA